MVAQSRTLVAGDYHNLRWIGAPRGADYRVNHGRPATGWSIFSRPECIRVPWPAARITTAQRRLPAAVGGGSSRSCVSFYSTVSRGRASPHSPLRGAIAMSIPRQDLCAGHVFTTLAGAPGFEPGTKDPKSLVLPLHHAPSSGQHASTQVNVCHPASQVYTAGEWMGRRPRRQSSAGLGQCYATD